MVSMPTDRPQKGFHIIGPCPGCSLWTLEYDDETAATYAEVEVSVMYVLGSEEPVDEAPFINAQPFYDVVESALQEHLAECHGLQQLLS